MIPRLPWFNSNLIYILDGSKSEDVNEEDDYDVPITNLRGGDVANNSPQEISV